MFSYIFPMGDLHHSVVKISVWENIRIDAKTDSPEVLK